MQLVGAHFGLQSNQSQCFGKKSKDVELICNDFGIWKVLASEFAISCRQIDDGPLNIFSSMDVREFDFKNFFFLSKEGFSDSMSFDVGEDRKISSMFIFPSEKVFINTDYFWP